MKEERHVIRSNYGLDCEEWRNDLETDSPDLSEDEYISLMYEINGDYLNDERVNLNGGTTEGVDIAENKITEGCKSYSQ